MPVGMIDCWMHGLVTRGPKVGIFKTRGPRVSNFWVGFIISIHFGAPLPLCGRLKQLLVFALPINLSTVSNIVPFVCLVPCSAALSPFLPGRSLICLIPTRSARSCAFGSGIPLGVLPLCLLRILGTVLFAVLLLVFLGLGAAAKHPEESCDC